MPALLDEALAVEHRPDIDVFVGDGHHACEPMVKGLDARGLILVGKLRRDAALWVPWTGPPTGRPGRPRKYAGRFDRTRIGELPAVELPDAGRRLHHAQLYYKPFGKLLGVVFVLDADEDPAEARKPTTLFATDPEMAPERIHRIHRDRFQIEFNFRDYRQHLGLAACQARTAARHHFHVNAVLAALAWTRLELRHAAARALDRFSMANAKPRTSWKGCCKGFWQRSGRTGPCGNAPRPCGPCSNWAKSSPNPPESGAHPGRIRPRKPHPGLPNPGSAHRGEGPCPLVSQKLFTPLSNCIKCNSDIRQHGERCPYPIAGSCRLPVPAARPGAPGFW